MKYIVRFIKGLLVGCVNIIPGVSAGTIAVVTNVYDEIITALSLDFKYIKKNFWKLLALGLGVIVGIVLFSKIIRFLFNNYYRSTMNFFVGLVIGSIPLLVKNALKMEEDSKRWVKWVVAGLCFAVVLTYSILMKGDDNSAVITTLSTGTFFKLMGLVAVSSIAMILPGLSGSLMMMFFGIYNTVIGAIADFNFAMLIPVVLGSIIGIVVGSIALKWLLNRFGKTTNFAIVALVLASLLGVYIAYVLPRMAFDWVLVADICALLAGIVGGYFLCFASQKGDKKESSQPALQSANTPIQLPDANTTAQAEGQLADTTPLEHDQPPKNE
ncbi:MAG: DUF368 domain-containing protein [Clostridia bacterium]